MNQNKLVSFLSEQFNVPIDKNGINGVYSVDNMYQNVVLELQEFILPDYKVKVLFEAIEKRLAKGFSIIPRGERESDARHYILFHN